MRRRLLRGAGALSEPGWRVALDRGGTFVDLVAQAPDGRVVVRKVLARGRSEIDALRDVVGDLDAIESLRVGTTVATNALLTRTGAPTALLVTEGFGDLLVIRHQDRPDLFAQTPSRPPPRADWTLEVPERVALDGTVEAAPPESVKERLAELRAAGAEAVAICLLHGHRWPAHEQLVGRWARDAGFAQVSLSHAVAPEIGCVARAETTLLHARLTPVVQRYADDLRAALPTTNLRFMKSSGGLSRAATLGGTDAVLSGPAGGVVACAAVAAEFGLPAVLGFDMGGTSTDVCRVAGELPRRSEAEIDGAYLRVPTLDVVTVAAGGGSVLRSVDGRLRVGPDSAGAEPGPACYGRGGPAAVTDANLVLGRLVPERFPAVFGPAGDAPLDLEAARRAIEAEAGDPVAAAAGFVAVADAAMAAAVQRLSSERGHDPAEHALVAFGGAAGQHACGIAARLGMGRVILHRAGSVLSAWGIAHAGARAARSAPVGEEWTEDLTAKQSVAVERLRGAAVAEVQAADPGTPRSAVRWDLRYAGSTTALPATDRADFERQHARLFGFARPGAAVHVEQLRVEAWTEPKAGAAPGSMPPEGDEVVAAQRRSVVFVDAEGGWQERSAALLDRSDLPAGGWVDGPALIVGATTTAVVDPGWRARALTGGSLLLERRRSARIGGAVHAGARLALAHARFFSIAERLGEHLRRVAWSVNIKERRDFSCAVFDADGRLIANAPHIPVHLGAMGETVRALLADPTVDLAPGRSWASNDPRAGGSHLPDITVITPVFAGETRVAFVASRGHHADVGGITPGSMPPFSTRLADEGVVLRNLRLVDGERFDEPAVRAALASGPHPGRDPDAVVADLQAQVAAGALGARLLAEAAAATDLAADFAAVLDHGDQVVRGWVAGLPDGPLRFADALDDGTPVVVTLQRRQDGLLVDFAGTGPTSAGNLNAPRAVVRAALLYVLRLAAGRPIPLNDGCLRPVELRVPPGSLLDPPPGAAVVGGNVETSQRLVDVLLGALGLGAASQGTMNNLSFGGDDWGAYETIAGGHGGTPQGPGASAMHSHMTNTRITDPEVLEQRLPLRVRRFAVRRGSGGAGAHPGGDGVVRDIELLQDATVALLAQRRTTAPFGLAGGSAGAPGRAERIRDGVAHPLPPCFAEPMRAGDRVVVHTPGGGGFGEAQGESGAACGGVVENP